MKFTGLAFVLLWFVWLPLEVKAQQYPDRPITLLLGFEAGGTLYTQAEVLAEILAEKLKQPVDLQVVSGSGGGLAPALLTSSESDGYLLLFTPSFPITDYPVRLQAAYQLDDFTFIGSVSADQHAFVIGPDAPYQNWTEFLEFAKQKGQLLYASQNLTDRLVMQSIADTEGFSIRVIPVSGGAGMAPLVIAGDVDIAFSGGTHSRYTEDGKMRVLAATGSQLVHYPEVPTLKELGYHVGMQSIRLLAAPKNLPDYRREVLAAALQEVLLDPRFKEVTENIIRQPVVTLQGDELHQFLVRQQQGLIDLMSETSSRNH